jgi:hypothetical protein
VRLGAFHGMDDGLYVKRYAPTVWAPPGVDHVEGVKTDRELVPGGELPLAGATLHEFETSKTPETVIHLVRHGGMLLACDSVQNWETTTGCSRAGAVFARLFGFRGRACIGPRTSSRAATSPSSATSSRRRCAPSSAGRPASARCEGAQPRAGDRRSTRRSSNSS